MKINRSIPPCGVIPEVSYPNVAEGAAWLERVFGFAVRLRIGNHRVQMRLGNGALIVTERRDDDTRRSSVMLRVEDIHTCCARALDAGGTLVRPPQDQPYGERQARVEDYAGNTWALSQTIADADPVPLGFEPGPAFGAH